MLQFVDEYYEDISRIMIKIGWLLKFSPSEMISLAQT